MKLLVSTTMSKKHAIETSREPHTRHYRLLGSVWKETGFQNQLLLEEPVIYSRQKGREILKISRFSRGKEYL